MSLIGRMPESMWPLAKPIIAALRETPLHLRLDCLGVYGFGSGFHAAGHSEWTEEVGFYCEDCPVQLPCWKAHMRRCAVIDPESVRVLGELAVEMRADGRIEDMTNAPENFTPLVDEYQRRTGKAAPGVELMRWNMQDGVQVRRGLSPKWRGKLATLPWPLKGRRT